MKNVEGCKREPTIGRLKRCPEWGSCSADFLLKLLNDHVSDSTPGLLMMLQKTRERERDEMNEVKRVVDNLGTMGGKLVPPEPKEKKKWGVVAVREKIEERWGRALTIINQLPM
jgi:hypothetical protein